MQERHLLILLFPEHTDWSLHWTHTPLDTACKNGRDLTMFMVSAINAPKNVKSAQTPRLFGSFEARDRLSTHCLQLFRFGSAVAQQLTPLWEKSYLIQFSVYCLGTGSKQGYQSPVQAWAVRVVSTIEQGRPAAFRVTWYRTNEKGTHNAVTKPPRLYFPVYSKYRSVQCLPSLI